MRLEWAAACLGVVSLWSCGSERVSVEVFVVSPSVDSDTIRYARRIRELPAQGTDPDTVARELTRGLGEPAILHSTSWRWERDGTVILTYLAYCESATFGGVETAQLAWNSLGPPPPTDPQHPRPSEIRQQDVVAHGLRHLSFLVRQARDGRLAAGLSPRSLSFFQALRGQLAGRLDTAQTQ